jgi:hypothetical protein
MQHDIILNPNRNRNQRMSQIQMIEFLAGKDVATEYIKSCRSPSEENYEQHNEMLFRKIIENLIGREEYKKLGLRKKPFYKEVHSLFIMACIMCNHNENH